jgi:hypothetical protein
MALLPAKPTVKLSGRAEAPAIGAEGAQFLSARGDNPEAHHGPLQRLLERMLLITHGLGHADDSRTPTRLSQTKRYA